MIMLVGKIGRPEKILPILTSCANLLNAGLQTDMVKHVK